MTTHPGALLVRDRYLSIVSHLWRSVRSVYKDERVRCCSIYCLQIMSGKETEQKLERAPGDGIKSLRTSAIFRVTNFELYAKPNKVVMGLGLVCLGISVGYIAYMRSKYEGMGYYTAVDKEGSEVFLKKKSKWDI